MMLFGYFFKVLTAGVEWTSCIPCVKQVDFFDVKALFEKIRSRVERGSRGGIERACVGFIVDSRARVDVLCCHFFYLGAVLVFRMLHFRTPITTGIPSASIRPSYSRRVTHGQKYPVTLS